jgi:hypothetical protein
VGRIGNVSAFQPQGALGGYLTCLELFIALVTIGGWLLLINMVLIAIRD